MEDKAIADKESKVEVPWAWIKAVHDILSNPPFDFHRDQKLPVELLPWLYLSDMHSVRRNPSILKNVFGITHVLTTNGMPLSELDRFRSELSAVGLKHYVVQGEDDFSYDMIGAHWATCQSFLQEARQSGGKVVVHCAAGLNRSGLIAGAAMLTMSSCGEEGGQLFDGDQGDKADLLSVVKALKAKRRSMVLCNTSFQKQLCMLAAKEGLLGDKPEGYSDEPLPSVEETKPIHMLLLKPPPPPPKTALDKLTL